MESCMIDPFEECFRDCPGCPRSGPERDEGGTRESEEDDV